MLSILCTLLGLLPFVMFGAVTANQAPRRRGHCERRSVPVAASTILYEGTMCFEDAGGDFAGTVVENGSFGGIVCENVDNSAGADAAKRADVWVSGEFLLPMNTTSLALADVGKPVYGSDNYTLTETATDLVPVGVITEVVSTSLAWVAIQGIGNADLGARAT